MKRKAVEKIELNIPNRIFYSILAVIALSLLSVGVYAYGTTSPSLFGHTIGELHPSCNGLVYSLGTDNSWNCIPTPPTCTGTGKALQYNPTTKAWGCVTIDLGYDCYWTGWPSRSSMLCYYNDPITCSGGAPSNDFVESYCSNGFITDTRIVYTCPNPTQSTCPPSPLPQ